MGVGEKLDDTGILLEVHASTGHLNGRDREGVERKVACRSTLCPS